MDVTRLRAANLADEKRAEIHKEQTVDLTGTLPGSSVPPDPGLSAKSPPSFLLLGPMGITDGNETIVLQPSKPSSLLAALLLHANSVVSASFLQRVVWGESGTTNARSTLHTCVQRLRRLFAKYGLSGNLIDSVSGGYRITADSGTLDLIAFRELLRKASAAPNPEAELLPLQAALTLWRDPVLANVHSDVLHREVVPRLAEERLLVEALYRTGRRADALHEYRTVKQYLRAELGVDPGPVLQRLELTVLRGDELPAGPVRPPRALPSGAVPEAGGQVLSQLVDAGLLKEGPIGFYSLHDSLRMLARGATAIHDEDSRAGPAAGF
jgi:DNA-binding winged helix-turn-helix (wHTH) protein